MFRNPTSKNARTRLRGFEGLETRELLAADLFAADSLAPVEEVYSPPNLQGYVEKSLESGDLGTDGITNPDASWGTDGLTTFPSRN